jgi:hypothetical protein
MISRSGKPLPLSLLLAATLLGLAGCGESPEIVTREVPEQDPPSEQQARPASSPGASDMAGMSIDPSGAPQPEWTVPPQWTPGPDVDARLGSFTGQGPDGTQAEIAVTAFNAGMPLPLNVNRWRRQIGLGPPPEGESGAQIIESTVSGKRAVVVIVKNPATGQTISVTIARSGPYDYFFKMSGDSRAVAAQLPAYADFIDSVTLPEPTANP